MNTLEFAQAALKILQDVPEDMFNIDACGTSQFCGCVMHWMFKMGTLPVKAGCWNVGTALHRIYNLEGSEDDKKQLRIILGFDSATDALYDVRDSSDITKVQVMQQLEVYINDHS